jgi:hypothetical protein
MKYTILLLAVLLSACTVKAPPYQASIENVQLIKLAKVKELSVGEFSSTKKLNSISLRGTSLVSPEGTYGDYLSKALEEELKLAKIWSGVSSTVVNGKLISNDIDVSGFSTGTGEISAEFVVSVNEKIVYQGIISATHEFDSSFIGGVAIPNGQSNYMYLVQKLIKNLFSDQAFIEAISR